MDTQDGDELRWSHRSAAAGTPAERTAAARYVCPRCHGRGPSAAPCPTCATPMVDGGALPVWGLGELAREFAPPPAGRALLASAGAAGALAGVALSTVAHVGEIAAVGVYWASLVAVAALVLRYGPEPDPRTAASPRFDARAVPWLLLFAATVLPFFGSLALGATTVLAFGVLGAVACSALAVALSARRAAPDPDAAAFEGLAPCASGDAPEGRVRLAGRVRVVTPTVTVEGLHCAAWEASTRAGGAVSVRSAGGVFELDDGGVRVVVQGQWVRVLGGGRWGQWCFWSTSRFMYAT